MDRRDYNNEEREVFNNDRGFSPRRRFNFSRSDYQNNDTGSEFSPQSVPNYAQPNGYSQPYPQNGYQQQYAQPNVPNMNAYEQPVPPVYPTPPQSAPQQGYQQPYVNPYYPQQEGGFDYDARLPQTMEMQQTKMKGFFSFKNKKQPQYAVGDMQNILIVAPKTLSEVQDIIDNLRNRQAIIVEFNKINEKYAQRILDFLNGAIYALGGCEQRIADNMFLFTPGGVSIQGPSSLKNRY